MERKKKGFIGPKRRKIKRKIPKAPPLPPMGPVRNQILKERLAAEADLQRAIIRDQLLAEAIPRKAALQRANQLLAFAEEEEEEEQENMQKIPILRKAKMVRISPRTGEPTRKYVKRQYGPFQQLPGVRISPRTGKPTRKYVKRKYGPIQQL